MAEEIEQFKQLQAGMNAAFDGLIKSFQEGPNNGKATAATKGQVVTMAQMTLGAVLGPAFSLIGLSSQHHAYAAVRIALELKLFEIVSKPTSLDELVQKTDADPVILQRILRAVCSIGYLKQTAVTQWEPSPLTQALNVPALRDWMKAHFDHRMVVTGRFPEWLKKRGHKAIGSFEDNVWTDVMGETIWEYYDKHPEDSAIFDSAMSIQENFPKAMLPPYPFSEEVSEVRTDPDAVTLVDIGGGFGQALKKIQAEYPGLKGRFVVQDLPKTISQIDAAQAKKDGFQPMAHDFFTPQPIKGAKYYHLRRVLHDWNDEACIKILQATRVAMESTADYSRLLIHDFVLPDVGCGFVEAMVDLMMMQTCDGMERTETQWHELSGKAGFKIVKIWRADEGSNAVIEAVVA